MKDAKQPTKVRDFLDKHGLSQKWLAAQLGFSPSLLRHYLDKPELDPGTEKKMRAAIELNAKSILSAVRGERRKFI